MFNISIYIILNIFHYKNPALLNLHIPCILIIKIKHILFYFRNILNKYIINYSTNFVINQHTIYNN